MRESEKEKLRMKETMIYQSSATDGMSGLFPGHSLVIQTVQSQRCQRCVSGKRLGSDKRSRNVKPGRAFNGVM